ncbi:hypothetical protein DFH27DRAFT_578000 [Peziza echinospora]|nr:hypothetical protein DFH27DRAFT_578000 [Peziza echinospora]
MFFICLDALDELNQKVCGEILVYLKEDFRGAKLFMTGRPPMRSTVNRILTPNTQSTSKLPREITIIADLNDIKAFLEREIERDDNPRAMELKLRERILTKLTQGSKGMFLLPSLQITMVLAETTIYKRTKALEVIPQTLFDVFKEMVVRVKNNHSEGMDILLGIAVEAARNARWLTPLAAVAYDAGCLCPCTKKHRGTSCSMHYSARVRYTPLPPIKLSIRYEEIFGN